MGWLIGYVATIFAANWAIATFGVVPVFPGLVAPAGVFFASLALTLRNQTQDALGRRWAVAAIPIGAALSAVVDPHFAIASGAAFLFSETADFLVYTPIRRRNWAAAMFAADLTGLVIDSALFLTLAFGSLDFIAGQVVGKLEMTCIAVALLWLWRRSRRQAVTA